MPSLKNLQCSVYWADTQKPLTELNTTFSDGYVETWLLVPERMSGSQGCNGEFYIQLNTDGYIAPGIAMFVYIDGIYQCNRNRRTQTVPVGTSQKVTQQLTLKARQREVLYPDGSMLAKPWCFRRIQLSTKNSSEKVEDTGKLREDSSQGKCVGLIEVFVLRCALADRTDSLSIFRVPTELVGSYMPLGSHTLACEAVRGRDDSIGLLSSAGKRLDSTDHRGAKRSGVVEYSEGGTGTYRCNEPANVEQWPFEGTTGWRRNVRAAADRFKARLSGGLISPTNSDDSIEKIEEFSTPSLNPAELRSNIQAAKMLTRYDYWDTVSTIGLARDLAHAGSDVASATDQLSVSALSEGVNKVGGTHRVHIGMGFPYLHKLAKPSYIDSHQSPYAVFRFYYRDKATLEHILERRIPENEPEEEERLEALSREELVAEILKLKTSDDHGRRTGKSECNDNHNDIIGESRPTQERNDSRKNVLWGKGNVKSGWDTNAGEEGGKWWRRSANVGDEDPNEKHNEVWQKLDDNSSGDESVGLGSDRAKRGEDSLKGEQEEESGWGETSQQGDAWDPAEAKRTEESGRDEWDQNKNSKEWEKSSNHTQHGSVGSERKQRDEWGAPKQHTAKRGQKRRYRSRKSGEARKGGLRSNNGTGTAAAAEGRCSEGNIDW